MKLQHIALAVALAAAGSAHATVDRFSSGNGSLFMIAFDNAGGSFNTTSSIYDLGVNLDDFYAGALGVYTQGTLAQNNTKVVWDFGANTLSINGTVQTGKTNAWNVAFDKLLANSDAGQIKWTIGAGDSVGNGTSVRYLVSGQPTATNLSTGQTSANTNSMSLVDGMWVGLEANGGKGTMVSADNGAFTVNPTADGVSATTANGYVIATSGFATNWQGKDQVLKSITTETKNNLWLLNGLGNEVQIANYTPAAGETITNAANLINSPASPAGSYSGTFAIDWQAKTLTWETAAVQAPVPTVPEPETYGLAAVGALLAGVVARRRRAA
ncbi:MAG: hypothetical protein RLZZ182_2617 [Pseudomonadota bacterium]